MAVLVTGGAGYIGSHMAWELIDNDEEVVVVDRLSTGFDWAVPEAARLVVQDIGDRKVMEEIIRRHRVEAIIHFAGSVIVPESLDDPLNYYHNNTVKTHSLLQAAVNCGVRHFVFSSTAAVYGIPDRAPVREEAALRPETPYGASKMMIERMLQDTAAAHDLSFTALRYFNVSGADPRLRTGQSTKGATHLIKVACEAATGKRPQIEVFGTDYPSRDGTCIRDFIHVSDLVSAHYLALQRLRAGGDSLIANAGYGRGHTVFEVIETVKRLSGRDFPVVHAPRRTGDVMAVVASSDRCRQELGWEPRYDDLDTIITHALQWEEVLARRNRL